MSQSVKNENLLETIRINKSEIKNILFKDNGKEFVLNGEIYDIKKTFFEGDYIIFHCVNDKKEQQLFVNLDSHIKNNVSASSSSSEEHNDISKSIVKDYFPSIEMISFTQTSENIIRSLKHSPVHSFSISFPSPPPEVSFS